LLVVLNMMFACLPFWRTGTMVICKCGGHISIEFKCEHESMDCCNCCEMDRNRIEANTLVCSCANIPISKDLDKLAVCCSNAEKSDENMLCVDYRISQVIGSNQPYRFHKIDYFSGIDKKVIDILRTTILLI
jgi:hypothetical protein